MEPGGEQGRAVPAEEREAVPRGWSVRMSLRFWAAGSELDSRLQGAGRGVQQEEHTVFLLLQRGWKRLPPLYVRNKEVMARLSCRLMKRKKRELECEHYLETIKLEAEERGVPSAVLRD